MWMKKTVKGNQIHNFLLCLWELLWFHFIAVRIPLRAIIKFPFGSATARRYGSYGFDPKHCILDLIFVMMIRKRRSVCGACACERRPMGSWLGAPSCGSSRRGWPPSWWWAWPGNSSAVWGSGHHSSEGLTARSFIALSEPTIFFVCV